MEMAKKTLYNLVRMHSSDTPEKTLASWQITDYRQLSFQQIFQNLHAIGFHLDKQSFLAYAEQCEDSEELADSIVSEDDSAEIQDQVYLLIFELWRRLLPDKKSLSIFCDEIDHRINLYDQGHLHAEELIFAMLHELEELFTLNSGNLGSSDLKSMFQSVQNLCANDLEMFLYDFISEQIEYENIEQAAHFTNFFLQYVENPKWFEFLQARILAVSDKYRARLLLQNLLKKELASDSLDFHTEIFHFLLVIGDLELFVNSIEHSLKLIDSEEDFQNWIEIAIALFEQNNRKNQLQALTQFLENRRSLSQNSNSSPSEKDKQEFLGFAL